MSRGTQPPTEPSVQALEPVSLAPLDDPLEFMLLQQVRQRALCVIMRQAAEQKSIGTYAAKCIASILEQDIALHRSDEDFDLFPALRRRGTAEDGLTDLINDLQESGANLKQVEIELIQVLSAPGSNDVIRISPRDATLMVSYALGQQRRLAVEHGILMVIARKRLTAKDLQAMSASMKKRRGITV